jgi:hypothetical protein
MTIAFPLGLTLQLGLYADAGPVKLRTRNVSGWGRTEVFVASQIAWDLTQVKRWSHHSVWSLSLSRSFEFDYGIRREWAHRAPYDDLRRHRARLTAPYSDRLLCRRSMRHNWWLTESVSTSHALRYAVTDTDPVSGHLVSAWSLLSDHSLQSVANSPELNWQGQRLRLHQATLSCDEDSPVWIASIELAELSDFAAINITDEITLTLGLETFRFIVDGKTLSRESMTDQRCEVTAVSPVALLDAPFAGSMSFHHFDAIHAREAVELLVGLVSWQLPDWIIPSGRLLLENVTPLQAVRNIVAALGGILESNPDGSLSARRRHPVSIPQYGAASVAHALFDADVITGLQPRHDCQ